MVNIKNASETYLNWKNSYAPIAAVRYKVRLDPFTNFVGENTLISDVTGDQVIAFHQRMAATGNYSPATIAYSGRILKNFFEFWKGRGIQCVNPKELRHIRFASPQKNGISEYDFKRMSRTLNELLFESLQRKLAIHMLYDTGMRVSELCDLRIGDLEETEITGMRCAKIRRRKTFRYNIVVWGKETNRLLNLYLGVRLSMDTASDVLFTSRRSKGRSINPRSVQRWIKEITADAGMKIEVSPHSFRHAKAHAVLNKSGNVRDVQAVLGHANPMNSFNYLHVNKKQFVKIAAEYLETT